jgi:hypothetical protein
MLELYKEIILLLIPVFFSVIGYLIYKKPKETVELIETKQKRWDQKEEEYKQIIEEHKSDLLRIEDRNKQLEKMLDLQSQNLTAILSTISGSYPKEWTTIKSWREIYLQIVEDGQERKVIRGDVFIGRSGYHSSEVEAGRLAQCGLIDYDKKADEIRILHKGHLVGQSLVSLDDFERIVANANKRSDVSK